MSFNVNFAHLHLLLNHFPVIGMMVGVGLFLASFFANTKDLRKTSLIVIVAMALLTVPTFVTGVGAQVELTEHQGVPNTLIERHQGSAELALWFMLVAGALAAIGLWQSGRMGRVAGWNTLAILAFSLATVGLMARTGNTGGEIRHSEVRANQTTAETIVHFEPSPAGFTRLMIASKWWWAFMMFLHFVGLVLVIGTIGLLDLRVLGFFKQLPIAPLNRLVPLGLAGLGINVATGMLAFIGMSSYYIFNIAFVLKIGAVLLAVAVFSLFYITRAFHDCEVVGTGEDAPLRAKIIAGASLALWVAVIVLGRFIQPLEGTISR